MAHLTRDGQKKKHTNKQTNTQNKPMTNTNKPADTHTHTLVFTCLSLEAHQNVPYLSHVYKSKHNVQANFGEFYPKPESNFVCRFAY